MIEGVQQILKGPDTQIMGRPKCGTPSCEREGWIFFAGTFRCGDCVNRLVLAQKEQEQAKLAGMKAEADKFLMETNAVKREARI